MRWLTIGLLILCPCLGSSTLASVSDDALLHEKDISAEDPAAVASLARTVAISAHGEGVQAQASDADSQKTKAKKTGAFFFKVHRPSADASLASMYPGNNTIADPFEEQRENFEDDDAPIEFEELVATGACPTYKSPTSGPRASNQRVDDLKNYDVSCPSPKLLSRWRVDTGGTADKIQMQWTCCTFAEKLGTCRKSSIEWENTDGSIMNLGGSSTSGFKDNKVGCTTAAEGALRSWKMVAAGAQQIKIEYECCALPPGGAAFGGTCQDGESDAKPQGFQVKDLRKHEVACNHGHAMFNWQMVKQGKTTFKFKWKCCPVGTVVQISGTAKTCRWVGDPHFRTFDGITHHPMKPPVQGFYWIVKNDKVQIQSYYQATYSWNDPMRTRGVAFAGKFLLGNKLIVKHNVKTLIGQRSTYRRGDVGRTVLWNKEVLPASGTIKKLNDRVSISRSGRRVSLILPLGITATINQYSYYSDQSVTMFNFAKQTGQCGANMKQRGGRTTTDVGSTLQNGYLVAANENLFTSGYKGDFPNKPEVSIQDCPTAVRAASNAICRVKFAGGGAIMEDFFNMCVLDMCNTPDDKQKKELVDNDEEQGMEQIMSEDFNTPRSYLVTAGAGTPSQYKATTEPSLPGKTHCNHGDKKGFMVAMPKSKGENRMLQEKWSTNTDAEVGKADMVWLGASKVGGKWKWFDGTSVTAGWTNWASGHESNKAGPNLCLNTDSGKWNACDNSARFGTCEEAKMYGRMKESGPLLARSACGESKQMAMPKNQQEQLMLQKIVTHYATKTNMWIGGHKHKGKWVWEDGAPVGDYYNWHGGKEPTQGDFMCIRPDGKWTACADATLDVLCEIKGPDRECPLSSQDMSRDVMFMTPPPYPRALFQDYCYYMAPGKQSCDEFCVPVFNGNSGKCSLLGTSVAAQNIHTCKLVLKGLGVDLRKEGKAGSFEDLASASLLGCTYMEREVQGKTQRQAMLKKPSPGGSATCSEKSMDIKEHRVCACVDAKDGNAPVDGYQFVNGDSIRVGGTLSSDKPSVVKIGAGSDQKGAVAALQIGVDKTGDAALQIEADPITETIKRNYIVNGKKTTQAVANVWPFAKLGKNDKFSMDITPGKTDWEISVMGVRYPNLDFPRKTEVFDGSGVELQGIGNAQVVLFNNDVPDPSVMRSVNTKNGCWDDMFALKADAVSFYFHLRPLGGVDGQRCLRCESKPFDHGSNIFLENGKLVVTVEGNAPRTQIFDWDFKLGVEYDVAISYVKADSVIELYINGDRKQFFYYQRAMVLHMETGQLGCYNTNDRKFSGKIMDYYTLLKTPHFRPLQARCSSFVCPGPGKVLKVGPPKPYEVMCVGSVCKPSDTATCCDDVPKCKPAFKCSQMNQYRHDAQDIFCTDLGCANTAQEHCCAPKAACTTYACPAGKLHFPEALKIFCQGDSCTKTDEDKCCQPVARCSSYDCPKDMTWKAKNKELFCTDRKCTTEDLDTCCTHVGTCDAFTCPTGYLHKPDAENLKCADVACTHTKFDICCAEEGKCSGYNCPTARVTRQDAPNVMCLGLKCNPEDEERCCEDRVFCNTLVCKHGHTSVKNASGILCEGAKCDVNVDHETCCAQVGFCSAYNCPPGYRNKPKAAEIMCSDQSCKATPFETCCSLDGMCSTYKCPASYVQKQNASIIHCDGTACEDSDLELCCDRAALCATNVCPPAMVPKAASDDLYCQDRDCSSADHPYCCAAKGICTSFKCPANTFHRSNAQILMCADQACNSTDYKTCCAAENTCTTMNCPKGYGLKDDAASLPCAGFQCVASDRDACCTELASCSSYKCPFKYLMKKNAKYLHCQDATCSNIDLHTCCSMEGYCTGYNCPDNWLEKPLAHSILCQDRDCNQDTTPFGKCCAEEGRCNSYNCPLGYVIKLNATTEYCGNWTCSDKDLLKCCDEVSMCSTHNCPVGFTLNSNHANIMCADRTCSGADHDLCCVPEGHCFSFECPPGTLHRHDQSLLCDDENCTNTNFTQCCGAEKRCNTYKCPKGFLHKDSSENIDCAGFQCNDADRDTCCSETGTCKGFACSAGTALKVGAQGILCSGATCTDDDILDCCTSEGKCDSYTCPPGYQHRHNAVDIFCEGASCVETDFEVCCVEEGHCHTYTCPEKAVHKVNSSELFCETWKCTKNDTDTCCDLQAYCNEAVCPKNDVLIWKANSTLCINRTCMDQDSDTCCTQEGKCDTLQCPPGYKHRHNAADIFCSDKNCTNTDYHSCCAEEDKCHSYSCPKRYVHKWNADALDCQGFVCTDTDQDTCCDFRSRCNSYVCDFSYVLKSDAEIKQCVNSTCEAQDRDTCCDHEGTCLNKECPQNFMHKADANVTLCTDKNCKNTDPNTCCEEKAKCRSDVCPTGYVQKASEEPLYCAGRACNAAIDTKQCCDKRAQCNTFVTPPGYFHKHNAINLTCEWSKCSSIDLHTCAADTGFCSSYHCPATFILKHDAHTIECEDLDCKATDYTHCCAKEGSCPTYRCPHSTVQKENAATLTCKNTTCGKADEGACCQTAGSCNELQCPTDFVQRVLSPYIYCDKRKCTDSNVNDCCVEDGKCSSSVCPAGFLHRHDAHSILCDDANCSATDFRKCCDEEGHCPTYKCPGTMSQKNMSEDIHCQEEVCTASDKHICCDHRQDCSTYACAAGFEWKEDYEDLQCEGRSCKASDNEICCAVQNATEVETTTTVAPETTTTVANAGDGKNEEETVENGGHRLGLPHLALFMALAGLLGK